MSDSPLERYEYEYIRDRCELARSILELRIQRLEWLVERYINEISEIKTKNTPAYADMTEEEQDQLVEQTNMLYLQSMTKSDDYKSYVETIDRFNQSDKVSASLAHDVCIIIFGAGELDDKIK